MYEYLGRSFLSVLYFILSRTKANFLVKAPLSFCCTSGHEWLAIYPYLHCGSLTCSPDSRAQTSPLHSTSISCLHLMLYSKVDAAT